MARRAALILTSRLPWPLDDGGRVASWQIVWSAAQEYDVTLLSLVPPGAETEPVPDALTELGIKVDRVPHRPPVLARAAAQGLFGRWPYTLARYQNAAFARVLRDRISALAPAYVLASPLHMAPYVRDLGGTPMILRQHNVEHVWMERYARGRGATPAGLYARVQAGRLRRAEASLCRAAALTLAIREEDTAALHALAPGARVETLPIGIDLDRFLLPRAAVPPVVLLAGSFAWQPNVEGALRFLADGWPRIRARYPGVRMRLAGKSPPDRLRAAARDLGAEVAADVPSMAEEFAQASVLVVPLWVGAGVRVKIIEAMAARLPVVATPSACEGLGLRPDEHYLEGATPVELADRTIEILGDRGRREALGGDGRLVAEERWSLSATAHLQNKLVAEATG
jgi:polysaccharide biosynthesis protein PslH